MAPEGLLDENHETEPSMLEVARELGQRGLVMVKYPHRSESLDVIDFDIEIARRKAAGFQPGVDFWTAELPEIHD